MGDNCPKTHLISSDQASDSSRELVGGNSGGGVFPWGRAGASEGEKWE